MKQSLAFLFPGQGAQYVGMGKDFFDAFSVAKETFEEANDLLSENFSKLIFEGPKEELTETKYSQIAIYVTCIALWRVVNSQFPNLLPTVCSGLSLGEYTALTAAGSLEWKDGVQLVRSRGLFMDKAAHTHPGTMAVALGIDVQVVQKALESCNEKEAWIANLNCPGQVVLSGTKGGIARMSDELKARGAKRVLPLAVSGAFHSGLMASAKEKLEPFLADIPFKKGNASIVMNVVGDYVTEIEERRRYLVEQIVAPVYWEKGVRAMKERGVNLFIEIGCGKTLSGMNRKMELEVATYNIEKVADLDKLAQVMEERNVATSCT